MTAWAAEPPWRFSQAAELLETKDYAAAVAAFELEIAKEEPEGPDAVAYCGLATSLEKLGRHQDAFEAATFALAANPGLEVAWDLFSRVPLPKKLEPSDRVADLLDTRRGFMPVLRCKRPSQWTTSRARECSAAYRNYADQLEFDGWSRTAQTVRKTFVEALLTNAKNATEHIDDDFLAAIESLQPIGEMPPDLRRDVYFGRLRLDLREHRDLQAMQDFEDLRSVSTFNDALNDLFREFLQRVAMSLSWDPITKLPITDDCADFLDSPSAAALRRIAEEPASDRMDVPYGMISWDEDYATMAEMLGSYEDAVAMAVETRLNAGKLALPLKVSFLHLANAAGNGTAKREQLDAADVSLQRIERAMRAAADDSQVTAVAFEIARRAYRMLSTP
jgi:tetratricopeptide (TPR) repeat protein